MIYNKRIEQDVQAQHRVTADRSSCTLADEMRSNNESSGVGNPSLMNRHGPGPGM